MKAFRMDGWSLEDYGPFFFVSIKIERKEKSVLVVKVVTVVWISMPKTALIMNQSTSEKQE